MAFTKVVGPGIHTLAQLRTHNIHSAGIVTATRFVGEIGAGTGNTSTFTNVNITGNLTVQGDTTTLNTTLRNVELLRVASNSTTTAGIITQTGAGDTSASIAAAGEFDRFILGSYHYDEMSGGHIQRVMYYRKRLPDTQLVTLTS